MRSISAFAVLVLLSLLQLSSAQESRTLVDGVPYSGYIPAGNMSLFTYTPPANLHDVHFSATAYSGIEGIVLLVSCDGAPTPDRYQWSAFADLNTGLARIDVSHNDPHSCAGKSAFYISLYSKSSSTFVIAGWTVDTKLAPTIPLAGMVAANNYHLYSADYYSDTKLLTFGLMSLLGNATMYITMDGSVPSASNYNLTGSWITLLNPVQTTYRIAVFSSVDNYYNIHFSSNYQNTQLINNVPMFGKTDESVPILYYRMIVTSQNAARVTVTTDVKCVDLYISQTVPQPSVDSFDYRGNAQVDFSITPPVAGQLKPFYIAVIPNNSMNSPCEFKITGRVNE